MAGAPREPLKLFDISGKVAIVTGASGAFGALAAETLAAAGARLVLAAGNVTELAKVASECRNRGAEVHETALRPSDESSCEAIVEATLERFGRIDILVVASGKQDLAKAVDMSVDRFQDVIDVNATQSWLIARAVGRRMLEKGEGGKIVLTSAVRGMLGHPAGFSAYCASKAALDGVTRALACEWGPNGVNVNAIAPTVFRSPMTEWLFGDDIRAKTTREGVLSRIPKGRLGEPEDLAGPLLFLASRASDFYTGHTLYVDGGYTAG
jgi:NAD(P)-dependent dehydrogenase (short-subunit alcohol dehydrogenase family)